MAVTVSQVGSGNYTKTWNVIASADGDTAATITHGFASTPAQVFLVPLLAVAYTAQWIVSTVNASQVILGKTSAGTSSNASAQLQVIVEIPYSMTQ